MKRMRHKRPLARPPGGLEDCVACSMRTYELRGQSIDTLARTDRPRPEPGPRQVLVRMRAASLNYRDLLIANGTYPRGPSGATLIPLSDGAGEVIESGAAAQRFKPRERVMGAFFQKWIDGPFDFDAAVSSALGGSIDGMLSEYVVLDEAGLVKVPAALSDQEAATLPCAGVSAWVSLVELGQVQPEDTVLLLGTGGVSIFALQLAKRAGATVIITSSSDEKLARAQRLGADHVINYRTTPEWDVHARELTGGRGVDHVLEVGGAQTLYRSLSALRDGGHIALLGQLSGEMADPDVARKNDRGIRVDQVFVGSARHLATLAESVATSGLRPAIDRVFPFEAAIDAYRYLERGAHFGKVVIRF
jgi:NADPH:quinone reductase-like Zn-dependent oxidoreductase